MRTHFENLIRNTFSRAIAGTFVLCLVASAILGQAPPNPVPAPENIGAGALVIPMDNINQGNAGGTTFNLRAYGLANLLLQNDIPVKWAIKPAKSKDAIDFSANVTRIAGAAGVAGPAFIGFSGGPFIISQEYDTPSVRGLISTFNAQGTAVTVYKTNADTTADIRYTLTHKPKLAIGPDGGNFGSGVHQDILFQAGIPNFASVTDDIINQNSCYTMATQAHSSDPTFVNLYRQFVESGGNLLLQCLSIDTFENNSNGHFQALVPGNPNAPGYLVYGTNNGTAVTTPFLYPEGDMPFNQFIGILADQDGAITEYAYAPGAIPVNGNRVSVTNTAPHAEKMVATVSELLGPGGNGGTVFEMGGHDYDRTATGASEIERKNGLRMFLNAIFVPANRPTVCNLAPAGVSGFKSVRRFNVRVGGPPLVPGDTLEWIIDYVNNSPVDITDFQIRDIIQPHQTLVAGSVSVAVFAGNGGVPSVAAVNPAYDGIGDDTSSDMLLPGAFLPVGGRIQVKVRTTINLNTQNNQQVINQTKGSGAQLVGTTLSDTIDATDAGIFGPGTGPPADSISQAPYKTPGLDPTVAVPFVSAGHASVDGMVRDTNGYGINRAVITVTNINTGDNRTVMTNGFGFYSVDELRVGDVYLISVSAKRYRFQPPFVTFSLSENVTGLSFIGAMEISNTKGGN